MANSQREMGFGDGDCTSFYGQGGGCGGVGRMHCFQGAANTYMLRVENLQSEN